MAQGQEQNMYNCYSLTQIKI